MFLMRMIVHLCVCVNVINSSRETAFDVTSGTSVYFAIKSANPSLSVRQIRAQDALYNKFKGILNWKDNLYPRNVGTLFI